MKPELLDGLLHAARKQIAAALALLETEDSDARAVQLAVRALDKAVILLRKATAP